MNVERSSTDPTAQNDYTSTSLPPKMAIPSPASQSPAVRRPWRQFANPSSFTLPDLLGEATMRLTRNLSYFRVNYALISLTILVLSLLFHPISLIVFLIITLIWYSIYISNREQPVTMLGREISDGAVLALLSLITIVAVGFSGVWLNIGVSVLVSLVVVIVHGVFRSLEDLYCDDEDEGFGDGMLVSVVGSPVKFRV